MISFFSIQGIVDQLQIISNPNTIDIDWLQLRSDSASLPRSLKLQRQHCIAQQGKHDGDCRPLQKKAKSGRPSGSGPKNAQTIRLLWCNARNETQFTLIGSWLSNICDCRYKVVKLCQHRPICWSWIKQDGDLDYSKEQSLDGRQNCSNWGRLRQSLLQSSKLWRNCRIDPFLAIYRDNDTPQMSFLPITKITRLYLMQSLDINQASSNK